MADKRTILALQGADALREQLGILASDLAGAQTLVKVLLLKLGGEVTVKEHEILLTDGMRLQLVESQGAGFPAIIRLVVPMPQETFEVDH